MGTEQADILVAKFADFATANKALRKLREAQRSKRLHGRKGAIVVGTPEGVMPVKDLDDMGVGDITSSMIDLAAFLGIGAAKIAAGTAFAGATLLLSSTRRTLALGRTLVLLPAKMLLGSFGSDEIVEELSSAVEPGVCAVVAVVNDADDAAQVAADLSEYGGELVTIEADAEDQNLSA